jgi:hypothetical protein
MTVNWDVASCSLVDNDLRFGDACRFHEGNESPNVSRLLLLVVLQIIIIIIVII